MPVSPAPLCARLARARRGEPQSLRIQPQLARQRRGRRRRRSGLGGPSSPGTPDRSQPRPLATSLVPFSFGALGPVTADL